MHRSPSRTVSRTRAAAVVAALTATALVAGCAGPSAEPGTTTGATTGASPSATAGPSGASSQAPESATAMACPDDPRPVTDEQRATVLALASERLAPVADAGSADGIPFGALRGETIYDRMPVERWTSGFFPAELWLLAQETGDPVWLERARQWSAGPIAVADLTTTHDLGFMVGLPMSLAMQADPANEAIYRDAYERGARSLATRWDDTVGAIKSGEYDGRFGVIVDSAMNQELLISGGALIAESDPVEGARITQLGIDHLRFLERHFIRPDGSTAHRITFDTATGEPLGEVAGQGEGPGSTWARGQAWAANGFARAHALTGDAGFLDTARRLSDFWIARVPAGCIPTWDLDLVDGPADTPLDSSALAIMAEGLLVLADTETDPARATAYRTYAEIALGTLARDRSLTDGTANPGILLRQTYNVPKDPRSGSYTWGDAYLLLALAR